MRKSVFVIFFILFFILMFLLRHYLSVYFFQNDRYKVAVNIETTAKSNSDIFVCFNKNCDIMQFKNNIYSYKLNQENPLFYSDTNGKIEVISFDDKFFNSIKNVSIFSKDFKYLTKFSQKEVNFQNKKAYSITLTELNHDKSIFKKLAVYFESIFYNWYFYIIFYLLICFYLMKYKPDIKIKNNIPIVLILFLGLFLRLSHIDFIPFWNDELYTLYCISDGKFNFLKTFSDPGNPPLFFIISNLWLMLLNKSITTVRLLPCFIGIFNIFSIYYVLNKILNKKTALIAAFLVSINIFIILESTEIRSYILSMTLVLWGGYYFYKLYKDFSNKNLILYFIVSALLINLHYYTILFVLFNFACGLFLIKNNKKFIIVNILSFLTIIPYLINVYKISLSDDFNIWLEKPTIVTINNHIVFYFGNALFLFLLIVFTVIVLKKYISKKEKEVIYYNLLSIAFVFILAFIFSILVKPILFERYFCIFLPFLIVNTAIFLNANYKTKYNNFIVCAIFLFSINIPKYENFNIFSNINNMMNYYLADNIDGYLVVPDNINYIKPFKGANKERVIVSNYGIREDKDLIQIYGKNIKQGGAVLYIPEICVNSKIKYSKKENIKTIQTTGVPVYKILLE